jgi:hypothetical protein
MRIIAFVSLALHIIGSFAGPFTVDKVVPLLEQRFAAVEDPARCLFPTKHCFSPIPEKLTLLLCPSGSACESREFLSY